MTSSSGSSERPTAKLEAIQGLRAGIDKLASELAQKIIDADKREDELKASQAAWERDKEAQRVRLEAEKSALAADRDAFEEEKKRMASRSVRRSDIITLNIGGEKVVQRRRSTLCIIDGSLLAARFSGRWEGELDCDEKGQHFINYTPELFMPLLDYLGMKETEDPAKQPPLPQLAEHLQPQFEAMLRFFNMFPEAPISNELNVVSVPYGEVLFSQTGFVFEIQAKSRSVSITEIETCASDATTQVSIYMREDRLCNCVSMPNQRDGWIEVGRGKLGAKCASCIPLASPVFLRANTTACLYLVSDDKGRIAFTAKPNADVVAGGDDHLEIRKGRFTSSRWGGTSDLDGSFWHFNGKIAYKVLA